MTAFSLASEDLQDLNRADALVLFTPAGRRGGCEVEFGIALALGKTLFIIGEPVNLFHYRATHSRTAAEFLSDPATAKVK
jgi:nucleoside 2-deoxyribosyltransferase